MDKKHVGKKAEPTIEELEFIYDLIPRLSDQEILEEMQDTEFPIRSLGFIKRRRREFEAARKVLEFKLKLETAPSLVKAKEDHIDEIRHVLEALKEAIKRTPMLVWEITDIRLDLNNVPHDLNTVKRNALFPVLKEHLPFQDFWQKYSNWETKYIKTFENYKAIKNKMVKQAEAWPELVILKDFIASILICITDVQLYMTLDKALDFLIGHVVEEQDREGRYLFYHKLGGEKLTILRTVASLNLMQVYKQMTFQILQSEEVTEIIKLFNELEALQREILSRLEEMLLRRDYIWYTCPLCPSKLI